MRVVWIAFGLMTACSGMARGQDLLGSLRRSDEYKAAYKQGRAEADRELDDQSATIFTFGLGNLFENLDRETGLPYSGFGCVVDDKIMGRTDGHNDRIMESIKADGPPKGSFKTWEKELFGLKDYVEFRRKLDKPAILKADGPALRSPDGSCTIKPFLKRTESNGKVFASLELEVSGDGRPPREAWLFANADAKVELFWGPRGSGFLVVAIQEPGRDLDRFQALDLRRGRTLRTEFTPRPERPESRPGDRSGPRRAGV